MDESTGKKSAILFGGTDGHGITMTAISERNLCEEEYTVETVCKYCKLPRRDKPFEKDELEKDYGTVNPEFFWGRTFLFYDFSQLEPGDIVVVVDIPLPLQISLAFSAADEAIVRIKELIGRGVRVILIDHHKRSITHYDKARRAGADVIFTIGSEQYCHYGNPGKYSLFWGRIGAACDRDPSVLPIEEDEFEQFRELERCAAWVDNAKRDIPLLLGIIRNCDCVVPSYDPGMSRPPAYCVRGDVAFIEKLKMDVGFKQLDAACAASGTGFGVGISEDASTLLAINYWKSPQLHRWKNAALPVALQLYEDRNKAGHDTAVWVKLDKPDIDAAKQRMHEVIDLLNFRRIPPTTSRLANDADAVDYISRLFQEIPPAYYLTIHGWNHVETVLANVRLLGAVSGVTEAEPRPLDWSALFHDIGNGAVKYDVGARSPDEARENHHEYTVKILRRWQEEGRFEKIIQHDDLDVICELCERHRKKSDPPGDPRNAKLCALLRIADALDKTRSRARVNDEGIPYSEVRERWEREGKTEPTRHWEGQRAIDSIRVHLDQEHITFEFLVTDEAKADFIIKDFEAELTPLEKLIPPTEIKITHVPSTGRCGSIQ
jgi:hypothetical protein